MKAAFTTSAADLRLKRTTMEAYDWQGTLEACQITLRMDPDHLGALETLAQAQWFAGRYNDVISTTSRLLRLNPLEPGYRYTRGMAHLSNGDLSLAQQDFRTALAQSDNAEFRAQVSSSMSALEEWITNLPMRSSRFSAPIVSPLGRLN